jgi:hypothetical protein
MKRLGEQVSVSFWYLEDARQCAAHVRSWHKADIDLRGVNVGSGGKADQGLWRPQFCHRLGSTILLSVVGPSHSVVVSGGPSRQARIF